MWAIWIAGNLLHHFPGEKTALKNHYNVFVSGAVFCPRTCMCRTAGTVAVMPHMFFQPEPKWWTADLRWFEEKKFFFIMTHRSVCDLICNLSIHHSFNCIYFLMTTKTDKPPEESITRARSLFTNSFNLDLMWSAFTSLSLLAILTRLLKSTRWLEDFKDGCFMWFSRVFVCLPSRSKATRKQL